METYRTLVGDDVWDLIYNYKKEMEHLENFKKYRLQLLHTSKYWKSIQMIKKYNKSAQTQYINYNIDSGELITTVGMLNNIG